MYKVQCYPCCFFYLERISLLLTLQSPTSLSLIFYMTSSRKAAHTFAYLVDDIGLCCSLCALYFSCTYHTLLGLLVCLSYQGGQELHLFCVLLCPYIWSIFFNEWIMGKIMKVSALCDSQDKLDYNAVTENKKSQWLSITGIYGLLVIHVQLQFTRISCSLLSLSNSAVGGTSDMCFYNRCRHHEPGRSFTCS